MDPIQMLGNALMLILKTLAAEIGNTILSANEKAPTTASSDHPLVYSPDDLASKLGISRASVDRWLLCNPPFTVKRVGKKILVPAQTFDSWLNDNDDRRSTNHD